MQQNEPRKSIISTGTASIVLIFVLLSLLTFAVLSLVSAQANLRLSRKSADRTTAYYAAENAASDVLLQLEDIMAQCAAGAPEMFADSVYESAQAIEGVRFTLSGSELRYSVPLGEDQALCVGLLLSGEPLPNGRYYQVTAWNTTSDYNWGADQSMKLFDPTEFFGGLQNGE